MEKFEYRCVCLDTEWQKLEDMEYSYPLVSTWKLDIFGDQGWELVQIEKTNNGETVCYFKRKIK